jgi:dipeptidyl aminopeptidase/acylaminoacyl peptidase
VASACSSFSAHHPSSDASAELKRKYNSNNQKNFQIMMEAPYGSWQSPIKAKDLAGGTSVSISDLVVDADTILFVENRPSEKGRGVLIRHSGLNGVEVTGKDVSVKTQVHEYGGGAIGAFAGKVVYSNAKDSRLYLVDGGKDCALTGESNVHRFANPSFHPDGKSVVAIREDHTIDEPQRIVNTIVKIEVATGQQSTLVESGTPNDFYSQPQYSPDGKTLSYLWWEHPNMPWSDSYLKVITDGETKTVAGGKGVSVAASKWYGKNLYYCEDSTGYWQLYRWNGTKSEPLLASPVDMEFATPEWTFGGSSYDVFDEDTIICAVGKLGGVKLALLDVPTKKLTILDKLPFSCLGRVRTLDNNRAVFNAATPRSPMTLYLWNRQTPDQIGTVLKKTSDMADRIDAGFISEPEMLDYSSKGRSAYAFVYPPKNPNYRAPKDSLPPCIVRAHGGPTAHSFPAFSPIIQYWTSRGFYFVDCNYSGSTGYGREYAKRLDGNWGIADVQDVVHVAQYLAEQKKVDAARMAICGGSAGGLTTLLALEVPLNHLKLEKVFKTGTSSYGVADLSHLAKFTHKFELRYLDGLMGGSFEEKPEVYVERSPVQYGNHIVSALVLQGADDKVVPPAQSEAIVEAIRKSGGKTDYIVFEGEGHGWRREENIEKALESEYDWYCKEFGLTPAKG